MPELAPVRLHLVCEVVDVGVGRIQVLREARALQLQGRNLLVVQLQHSLHRGSRNLLLRSRSRSLRKGVRRSGVVSVQ